MNYVIRERVGNKINTFYHNVAKKYKHTYSEELMHKNMDDAYNAIYQIENGLLRKNPTISRWQGLFMATSQNRRWNFAYRIDGDTIYVEDACHAQNMHESRNIIRLTKFQLHKMIAECVTKIMKEIV